MGTHRIKRDKFTTKDKQNLLKLWCYFYRKNCEGNDLTQYNYFELKYINLVFCMLFSVMLSVNHVYITMKYLAASPFNHPRKSLHCSTLVASEKGMHCVFIYNWGKERYLNYRSLP